jgi:predicted nucleotidyltransferase
MCNSFYGHLTYRCAVNDSDIDLAIDADSKDDRTKCLQYGGQYVRRALRGERVELHTQTQVKPRAMRE